MKTMCRVVRPVVYWGFLFVGVAGGLAQTDAEFEMVVTCLKDRDKEMRSVGLELVRAGLEGEQATKRLVALLPDLPPESQGELITALADRGDVTARDAILEYANGEAGSPARVAAIRAIGYLGNAADVPLLVKRIAEGPEEERNTATAALTRLQGNDVLPAIVAEMHKAEPPMQIALIEILTNRRALPTLAQILKLALSDNADVRGAAMGALSDLGGPEHIEGMVAGVLHAKPDRERDAAEKAVSTVCNRIEDADRRAEPLLAAYKKLPASDQRELLSLLGRVGGTETLQIVERAIASDEPTMHGLGIRALCNWPDASVMPRLVELARNDKHDAHRLSALRALIRLASFEGDGRTNAERLEMLGKAMELATRYEEQFYILDRARTILDIEALRFVVPYMNKPPYEERACLSVVELAHHRGLREPHKQEFDAALDKVIELSQDNIVVDRARRYKKGETWVRPANASPLPQPPKTPLVVTKQSNRSDLTEADSPEIDVPKTETTETNTSKTDIAKTDTSARAPDRLLSWAWIMGIVVAFGVVILVGWMQSRPPKR